MVNSKMSLFEIIKRLRYRIPVLFLSGIFFFLSCSNSVTGPEFGPERKIVYVLDNNLFITNPEGTGLKQLTFTSNHWTPAWSPDGEKIAFGSNQLGNFDVFVINIDGSNMTRLTSESVFGNIPEPRWSPNGTKIAFASRGNIFIMNSDGSILTQLSDGIGFRFSPDGSRIVYFKRYNDLNLNYEVSDMYIMNSDGSGKTLIATGERNSWPEFSLEGTKIVFVRSSGASGFGHFISIMNVDGTDKTRLTFGESINSSPSFSPDGSKIVFASYRDGGGNAEIYTMNVDGTNQTRLTHNDISLFGAGISSFSPKWSPDGDYIVYNTWFRSIPFETVKTTLKIMRSDGSQQVLLASINSDGFISFAFSPVW